VERIVCSVAVPSGGSRDIDALTVLVLPARDALLAGGVPLSIAVSAISAREPSSSSSLVVWDSEVSPGLWNGSPISGDTARTSFARELLDLGPPFPEDGSGVARTDGYLALRNVARGE